MTRFFVFLLFFLSLLSLSSTAASAADLVKHTLIADGHPMALWEKSPHDPKAQILLLHGRTWSSLPDFDLQGEFDPLAPTNQQSDFFTGVATSNKTWVVLPGGDHAALLETPRLKMLQSIDFFIQSL